MSRRWSSRIIDEDIYAPKLAYNRSNDRFHFLCSGHICRDSQHPAPCSLLDFQRCLLQGLCTACANCHPGPFRSQCCSACTPKPFAGRHYKRYCILQSKIHVTSPYAKDLTLFCFRRLACTFKIFLAWRTEGIEHQTAVGPSYSTMG